MWSSFQDHLSHGFGGFNKSLNTEFRFLVFHTFKDFFTCNCEHLFGQWFMFKAVMKLLDIEDSNLSSLKETLSKLSSGPKSFLFMVWFWSWLWSWYWWWSWFWAWLWSWLTFFLGKGSRKKISNLIEIMGFGSFHHWLDDTRNVFMVENQMFLFEMKGGIFFLEFLFKDLHGFPVVFLLEEKFGADWMWLLTIL